MLRVGETAFDLITKGQGTVTGYLHGKILVNGEPHPIERYVRPPERDDRRSWMEKMEDDPDFKEREEKRKAAREKAKEEGELLDFAEALAVTQELQEGLPSLATCKQWNGHWGDGKALPMSYEGELWLDRHVIRDSSMSFRLVTDKQRDQYRAWLAGGEWEAEPLEISGGIEGCSYCGQRVKYVFDGEWRVEGLPCPHPDGLPTTTWELNIPSGKIVVANDLRDLFPMSRECQSVNLVVGRHETQLAYAEVGMSHGSVGNTCPDVWRKEEGSYLIANGPPEDYKNYRCFKGEDGEWQEETEEWAEGEYELELSKYGQQVASVCTDLWWYSIVDYDEYHRRSKFQSDPKKNMAHDMFRA